MIHTSETVIVEFPLLRSRNFDDIAKCEKTVYSRFSITLLLNNLDNYYPFVIDSLDTNILKISLIILPFSYPPRGYYSIIGSKLPRSSLYNDKISTVSNGEPVLRLNTTIKRRR